MTINQSVARGAFTSFMPQYLELRTIISPFFLAAASVAAPSSTDAADDIEQFSSDSDDDPQGHDDCVRKNLGLTPKKRKRDELLEPECGSAKPSGTPSARFEFDPMTLVLDDGKTTGCPEVVVAAVNEKLLPYQREGVRFLHGLYKAGRGGILADEMGLGKTVQAVCFVMAIKGGKSSAAARRDFFKARNPKHKIKEVGSDADYPRPARTPVFVVAPAGLLSQWHREFRRWSTLRAFVAHGKERDAMLDKAKQNKLDVLILSYETFKSHFAVLSACQFCCAIFDEAHRIKNAKSKLSKLCARLKVARRYALTGTVIQNAFDELHALVQFVAPHVLGDAEQFKRQFVTPIAAGFAPEATESLFAAGREATTRLVQLLQAYMLRRTKASVAQQLPPKEERLVFCSMTPHQRHVYNDTLLSRPYQRLLHNVTQCSCGSGYVAARCCYTFDQLSGEAWRQSALPAITRLQQQASHADAESGKLKVLLEDAAFLPAWLAQGDRVLLFSNSVQTLDVLEESLRAQQISLLRMDGSTPVAQRQRVMDQFTRGQAQLLLASTRACGLGLNVSAANVVVIFEPNWNVALDAQAADRAHRLGQQRTTRVYRFVTAGSIEELMYRRQRYKQHFVDIAHHAHQAGAQRRPFADADLFGSALIFSFTLTAVPFPPAATYVISDLTQPPEPSPPPQQQQQPGPPSAVGTSPQAPPTTTATSKSSSSSSVMMAVGTGSHASGAGVKPQQVPPESSSSSSSGPSSNDLFSLFVSRAAAFLSSPPVGAPPSTAAGEPTDSSSRQLGVDDQQFLLSLLDAPSQSALPDEPALPNQQSEFLSSDDDDDAAHNQAGSTRAPPLADDDILIEEDNSDQMVVVEQDDMDLFE